MITFIFYKFILLGIKGENNVDDDECMHTYLFRLISNLAIRLVIMQKLHHVFSPYLYSD